ncbi:probable LRR receptor-like serine/threonine-protein kinase At1g53430 [Morus notabilis]|uniref:probable LRR receptor-like serine/threonine-protein kinase At1g53430 n=1 Tax=Morus notabilis TaxID=981085 RepID=UPI000CED75EA|nr:probable LRR receptor-like serine/threonine-protein kinase At1g53430 [Morus notabilis]
MGFVFLANKIAPVFGYGILALSFFINGFGCQAQLLPPDEVQTLQTISRKLELSRFWNNISDASCNRLNEDFNNTIIVESKIFHNVSCECSYENNTVCHINRIFLKGLNLTGVLPEEFGRLAYLEELDLSLNYFYGSIPPSFGGAPLRNLSLFGNRLNGSIPEQIGNITTLRKLDLEDNQLGVSLPQTIGRLRNLEILKKMLLEQVPCSSSSILSANSFRGTIPESFGNLKNLTDLRISDLVGSKAIPFPSLRGLTKLERLILRNCFIYGTIPSYIGELTNLKTLDLSFNNLTSQIPKEIENPTLLELTFLNNNSLTGEVRPSWMVQTRKDFDLSYNNFTGSPPVPCGNMVSVWCFKKGLPCPGKSRRRSLYINCGGPNLDEYEGDESTGVPSYFFSLPEKWAYSSTGVYIAAVSLKYYGLCLRKGRYKVKLHFAEIMFSDDQTFSSLGRRIFDVSIQGNLVLKDFNIMEEAGGPGKGITKTFDNVFVNGSTLEIHLYWPGKGATAIPDRGVYGPLISAIAITSYVRKINSATGNFDPANKIGEGGFGPVYKGVLSDGGVIAVKQLSSKSKQGTREFVNEIGMISALQHPNLVRLFGCCTEGNQLLLIYEYMENNSLARALFGRDDNRMHLDWPTRKKILLGIARGLAYLHEESRLKIVHRDIKATNVLLDRDLNAKISDFGLAKLDEEEHTHIST